MDPKFYRNYTFTTDSAEPISENNGPDSPSSGEDYTKMTTAPSPKKRRGVQKRVVSVPIGGDVEGSKSRGDGYPPSDSWAWRKYGQKPIKGSPYPRAYYRCSSSKGCPARKQVERSRVDPTELIITYACDHNHALPTTKAHHTSATAAATSPAAEPELPPKVEPNEELPVFASHVDLELSNDSATLLNDFGWFSDVASTVVLESPICLGNNNCINDDVPTRLEDEDEYLFADLGELPEGLVVSRHRMVDPDEQNQRCCLSSVSYYGST